MLMTYKKKHQAHKYLLRAEHWWAEWHFLQRLYSADTQKADLWNLNAQSQAVKPGISQKPTNAHKCSQGLLSYRQNLQEKVKRQKKKKKTPLQEAMNTALM